MRVFIVSKISRSSLLFSISGRIKIASRVKDKVGKIRGTAPESPPYSFCILELCKEGTERATCLRAHLP